MIFTRLAWLIGLAIFGAMCWLAIDGFKPVVPVLVTAIVLVALVGAGNVIGGRSSYGGGRPRQRDPGGGGNVR